MTTRPQHGSEVMAFPTLYFVQRIHLWIKSKKGKAKGTWNSPSPDYYQTSVMKVLHRFTVTRSNFKNKEESPYKPDPVLLRGITIHLDL